MTLVTLFKWVEWVKWVERVIWVGRDDEMVDVVCQDSYQSFVDVMRTF